MRTVFANMTPSESQKNTFKFLVADRVSGVIYRCDILYFTMLSVTGTITQGFRIASGLNTEGVPGPNGQMIKDSFVRQRPFFEAEIPELKAVWTGTINVNIAPQFCKMLSFDHEITCEWHPGITETFGVVSGVAVQVGRSQYVPAFIYYPMPSDIHTPRHELIEVLAPKIEGLSYGDKVTLFIPDGKVEIVDEM